MVKKKRASKRLTLKDKYKVIGKVKEHHRKQRRDAKKRARTASSAKAMEKALRKDPGLPNLCPYKATLMSRMAAAKEKVEKGAAAARARRSQFMRKKRDGGASDGGDGDLEALVSANPR